ncbi:SDR family oxidoreductase [Lentzea sp. NPDC004782]|uniref:SDR family oxidoreductase n=1 Tax=Lentzea sp. NPDC004782 TaxID=3154458 RepID=UPI0033A355F0
MLDGKVVVVSGVGDGLGHQVAAAVVRDGGYAVLGARTEASLAKTVAAIDPDGTRTAYRVTDITRDDDVAALAELASERFGAVDALVNVAAMDRHFGGLEGADFETWHQVVDVNLMGTLRMTRACLPALKARGGSVVMIGTQAEIDPPAHTPMMYAASKAALTSAMYSLARQFGPHRIRVNSVLPGWMWSPKVESFVRESEGDLLAQLTERMALPEMATEGDVAEAVVFLASDRARAITGQTLLVNAGEVMR